MRLTLQVPAWATAIASDLTDMDRDPQSVEPGGRLEYELPDDVYFQYAFVDKKGEMRPDPHNDKSTRSVWYGELSVVTGPDYRPDPLAEVAGAGGEIDRLRLEPVVGEGPAWRVSVYSPPDQPGELPLVIVQDGVAFLRLGKPHIVADALVASGQAVPARFAFVEPHDRNREYAQASAGDGEGEGTDSDGYQRFLAERLEPELTRRYPSTARRVYLGASLGASASARAAIRRVAHDVDLAAHTTVLAFSGAFLGTPDAPDPYRSTRSWLLDRVKDDDGTLPARWYLEVGTLEWLLDVNREVALALATRPGVTAELTERSAGHNWTSWRNGLASGLRFALAPHTDTDGA